jgi:hypothetical protein
MNKTLKTAHRSQLTAAERQTLKDLQEQAIRYFLENQLPNGLVLDRQANSGPLRMDGMTSTSATGMGLIAIALASSPEHHMITRAEAIRRVRLALDTCLNKVKTDHGMMPHFTDPVTLAPMGSDVISTIDAGWLLAGGLWAAEYLDDQGLKTLANRLYDRVDWTYWTTSATANGGIQIQHGADDKGAKLKGTWDRFNGETAVLYMLGIGARGNNHVPATAWRDLATFEGVQGGLKFVSADLGLFVFQYGNELIDFNQMPAIGRPNLDRESRKAALANFIVSHMADGRYKTYSLFWGLSAGDGPGAPGAADAYRAYSPVDMDGTAHITASLASIEEVPELVMLNLEAAERATGLPGPIHGRYGYSNVNLDRNWVSHDVVGIDMGAEVMALENMLQGGKVRQVWQKLPVMRRAVRRLKELPAKAQS